MNVTAKEGNEHTQTKSNLNQPPTRSDVTKTANRVHSLKFDRKSTERDVSIKMPLKVEKSVLNPMIKVSIRNSKRNGTKLISNLMPSMKFGKLP